jgi:hypothetical protein
MTVHMDVPVPYQICSRAVIQLKADEFAELFDKAPHAPERRQQLDLSGPSVPYRGWQVKVAQR